MTRDSESLQVDELIDSNTYVSSNSDSDTESYLKTKKLNVLTKEQETFLELVKHISDLTLQKEYLDKLLKTLELGDKAETSTAPNIKKNTYDLTEILDKKKQRKQFPISKTCKERLKKSNLR